MLSVKKTQQSHFQLVRERMKSTSKLNDSTRKIIQAESGQLRAVRGEIFRIFEALLEFHLKNTDKTMIPMGKKTNGNYLTIKFQYCWTF